MSRSKLFNMIKSRGTQPNGRNDFDLSNAHVYSQKAGLIQPIKALHCIPDDFLKGSVASFAQTFPMNTAAFLRGKNELSAYFVPYNTIWHNFNQYQATREDPESSLLQKRGILHEPRFPLYYLYLIALDQFAAWVRYHYFVPYDQYIQDGMRYEMGSTNLDNSHYFAQQKHIYQLQKDWLLYTAFEPFINGSAYKMENEDESFMYGPDNKMRLEGIPRSVVYNDVVGRFYWNEWVRKLDMLGYGNIYPLFSTAISEIETYVQGTLWQYNTPDEAKKTAFETYVFGSSGLMRRLAYRLKVMTSSQPLDINQGWTNARGKHTYVSVYPLFAYNKIFYDMFRNSYYDLDYSVSNYNCDFIDASTLAGSVIWPNMLSPRFYQLEYHQWKKDMFTGVLPDTQFGAVSNIVIDFTGGEISGSTGQANFSNQQSDVVLISTESGIGRPTAPMYVTNYAYLAQGADTVTNVNSHPSRIENPHSHDFQAVIQGSDVSGFDVLALRRAECLQQYRQDLLRAGNRTRDIFQQIYGTSPKSQLDEAPYFIDAVSNDIFVDPVVSTASTGEQENGSLGDIAARAMISGKELGFKFSTKDFGVIIFLSYIVPESLYNSYRIDPHLMNLTQEDHFIPQLQNLGFSPVLGEWLNNLSPAAIRNRVVGYAPPYLEFKTDVDMCHGAFVDCSFGQFDGQDASNLPFTGSLSQWVAPRTDMQNEVTTSLRNFYVNPSVLDNVFLVEADETYETDQFICITNIGVQAVRQLSEIGLPRFC